jgi:UDP-N-acetylglucosamine 2-epimerase (non-hydrolysing)
MKRSRVMTIVGTRPEIIKLSRVIAILRESTDHLLVHTGQNYAYGLNEVFFRDLKIAAPDHYLDAAGASAAETIGNVISKTDALLEKKKPDAVLLLGDTNSCLSAIPAKRRRIPIFHMEAGNRCFDARVPEETNRKIVDHLSDINLPYTEHARRYLLAEGLRPETVIKTGSPMKEVLTFYRPAIDASDVLSRLGLDRSGYFVASSHREETVDDPAKLARLLDTLEALARTHRKPIVFSTHPRTRKRLKGLKRKGPSKSWIRFLDPLGFPDYVKLQKEAFCTVSDSGTLTEEAALLGFPAVMLRESHERPEGMDQGTVVMAGVSESRVLEAVDIVTRSPKSMKIPPDYDVEDVSSKVVRIIISHIDFVNRTVWYV